MNDEIAAYIEREIGRRYISDWTLVDQALIDRFADTTRDWSFIHVNVEAAAKTEFGGTIAHGFLLLSLMASMRIETPRDSLPGMRVGVNYGFERVRFINPVRAGSRIRGVFTIKTFEEVSPGRFREDMDAVVEIEGNDRPAVVSSWLTMYML